MTTSNEECLAFADLPPSYRRHSDELDGFLVIGSLMFIGGLRSDGETGLRVHAVT